MVALAADGQQAEEDAGSAGGAMPPPLGALQAAAASQARRSAQLFRAVLRHGSLEVEARLAVHRLYPVQPPLVRIVSVRELPAAADKRRAPGAAPGVEVGGVNLAAWLEAEANVAAVALVPAGMEGATLQSQLYHLALCVDEVAAMRAAEGSPDLMAQLAARQRLHGRARTPGLLVLPPARPPAAPAAAGDDGR